MVLVTSQFFHNFPVSLNLSNYLSIYLSIYLSLSLSLSLSLNTQPQGEWSMPAPHA